MSYANSHHFSIGGFAIACVITLALNGAVLLGFNQLAESSHGVSANSVSQLAGAQTPASQATL